MRKFFVLLDREVKSYFYSPVAYIVLCFFLALNGYNLFLTVRLFNGHPHDFHPQEFFFNNGIFWFSFILIVPLITMRLYSEEFKLGTLETLMTAPVRDWQVVAAKFGGALLFYLLLWTPTFLYLTIFQFVTKQTAAASPGAYGGTFLMLLLMGLFYLSIGCLASVVTQNQIVAAVISLVTTIIIFFTGVIVVGEPNVSQHLRDMAGYFSSYGHMVDFSRGLIDTRPIVYYLSLTFLLQVITFQIFQYRRWKF